MSFPFDEDPEREARRRERENARREREQREAEKTEARRRRAEARAAATRRGAETLRATGAALRPRVPAFWTARRAAEPVESNRFLTLSMLGALGFFFLFALTFDHPHVDDDGVYYFQFLRRLFGADAPGFAYQFGSTFWNLPFFAVGDIWAGIAGADHYHYGELAITVAANASVPLILYLGWLILRDLELPRGPSILLLTLFGTPLFFYAVMRPSYKHAADTLYATAAFWLVLRMTRSTRAVYPVAAGACFALLLATRYANIALLAGVLLILVRARRWWTLWLVMTSLTAVGAFLWAIPVAFHIPFTRPDDFQPSLLGPPLRLALGPDGLVAAGRMIDSASLDLLAPFKMLFTLHRGLFIWTPLTAFATVGYILLLRRDREHHDFLLALGTSALALLLIHFIWGTFWDGGGSFSNRFLTALFPLYLIGTAEFVRRWGRNAVIACTVVTLWSVWIGLVQMNGYRNNSANDGVVQIVQNYTGPHDYPPPYDSLGNFAHEMRVRVQDRWALLWRVVT